MWIALNDSFLSIVDKARKPGCLMVRARKKGDIEAVFPGAKVTANAGTDYKYRAEIEKQVVASTIAERVLAIDYDNFKNSVVDHGRHSAYSKVWSALWDLQR